MSSRSQTRSPQAGHSQKVRSRTRWVWPACMRVTVLWRRILALPHVGQRVIAGAVVMSLMRAPAAMRASVIRREPERGLREAGRGLHRPGVVEVAQGGGSQQQAEGAVNLEAGKPRDDACLGIGCEKPTSSALANCPWPGRGLSCAAPAPAAVTSSTGPKMACAVVDLHARLPCARKTAPRANRSLPALAPATVWQFFLKRHREPSGRATLQCAVSSKPSDSAARLADNSDSITICLAVRKNRICMSQ